MKYIIIITFALIMSGCASDHKKMNKIIFLHHSTGYNIWLGATNKYLHKIFGKADVKNHFASHNRTNKTAYKITQQFFPKSTPYGWSNYPYDYYNIWVKNGGENSYLEEPTLEILTKEFDVIIFKHCFPVSRIVEDSNYPDINSSVKSLENYKLQYEALKNKMHQFSANKFIIWTPAANTQQAMTEDEAKRTRQFYEWMMNEWDEKGDNIFIWDFYHFETQGGLYMAGENAYSPGNSHPNKEFSTRMAPIFARFIIDVIENRID